MLEQDPDDTGKTPFEFGAVSGESLPSPGKRNAKATTNNFFPGNRSNIDQPIQVLMDDEEPVPSASTTKKNNRPKNPPREAPTPQNVNNISIGGATGMALTDYTSARDAEANMSSIVSIKPGKEYTTDKFVRDIQIRREDLESFLNYVTLLHRFSYEGDANAQTEEDRAIGDVIRSLGYRCVTLTRKKLQGSEDNNTKYIRIKSGATGESNSDFAILGVNYYSETRERMSLLIQEKTSNPTHGEGEGYLIVKGTDKSMKGLFRMSEQDKNAMRELVNSYRAAGLRPLVYGYSRLTASRVRRFQEVSREIVRAQREQLEAQEALSLELERDLTYLGCLVTQENVSNSAVSLTKSLIQAGISVSILSGDTRENTLNVAQSLDLVAGGIAGNKNLFLIGSHYDEIERSLRRMIDMICEDLKTQNKQEMATAQTEADLNSINKKDQRSKQKVKELDKIKENAFNAAKKKAKICKRMQGLKDKTNKVLDGLESPDGKRSNDDGMEPAPSLEDGADDFEGGDQPEPDFEHEEEGGYDPQDSARDKLATRTKLKLTPYEEGLLAPFRLLPKSITRRALIIRGATLKEIFAHDILVRQLRAVLYACDRVIGFGMLPLQKVVFVNLLKDLGQTVMAIGDGYNDIGMIQEASIGIQIINRNVPLVFGDAIVNNLEGVERAIFSKTISLHRNVILLAITYVWICLSQVAFYVPLYFQATMNSEFFLQDQKTILLINLLVLTGWAIFESPYNKQMLECFPVSYSEQKVLRRTLPVIFVSATLMSFIESTLVMFALSQFSLFSDVYALSIEHMELCLVFVSAVNSAIKLTFCYSYTTSSFKGRLLVGGFLIVLYTIIILLSRSHLFGSQSDIVQTIDWQEIWGNLSIITSGVICVLVPSLINWIGFELGKTYCVSIATRAIQKAEREIILLNYANESRLHWRGSENQSSYFVNERQIAAIKNSLNSVKLLELKVYLNWFVKYTLESRFSSRFNFTTLVSDLKKLTHGVVRNVGLTSVGGVRKLLTLDLFNYHVGLQYFTNFISERVERKKFRNYLIAARQGDIRLQMCFYCLLLVANYLVGFFSESFGYNYMLDTTVPYKLVGLLVIIYVLSFQSLSRNSRLIMVAFGVISTVITLVMNIFSHNRFDMNLIDFATSRLWLTSVLETVDSLCLVSAHLLLRLIR